MMGGPSIRPFVRFLLIAALVFGVALRFLAIAQWKKGLSHDESVSYMCAAATEGAYQEQIEGLVDRPMVAGALHAFYARPTSLQLRTVAYDLALYDIHPPLFFWAMHIQQVLLGTGINGGLWINFAGGLFLLVLTFVLARRSLGSIDLALTACAIWYLSPAVVQIDLEARQYQFMAVCAMASYLLTQKAVAGDAGFRNLSLFTLVNALGLLSHYYYAFVLIPGTFLVWRSHGLKAASWRYLASLIASAVLFLVLFPEFFDFLASYPSRPKDLEASTSVADRLKTMLYASLAFFAQARPLRYVFLLLGVLGLGTYVRYLLRTHGSSPFTRDAPIGGVVVTLAWCIAFTAGLYLLRVSPSHAVGEQYYAYFWPLLAIVLVHMARSVIPSRYRAWILVAYMLQLGQSFTTSVIESPFLRGALPAQWYGVIDNSDLLVTDDWKRSFLPRTLRDVPADKPLYLMKLDRPDVHGMDQVAFVHLAITSRPTVTGFTQWMADQGFVQGEIRVHDHYELHTYHR